MIALNIPTPTPTPIQRLNLVRLAPPLVPAAQYCGIVRAREGESLVCAIVHPYRTAHLYASAFTALFPLLQAEVYPGQQMSEITWMDAAYISPDGVCPQFLLRTTHLESATEEIAWQDRDLNYARNWESRVLPIIDLLELIKRDSRGRSRMFQAAGR
jgi:hypothetical protein